MIYARSVSEIVKSISTATGRTRASMDDRLGNSDVRRLDVRGFVCTLPESLSLLRAAECAAVEDELSRNGGPLGRIALLGWAERSIRGVRPVRSANELSSATISWRSGCCGGDTLSVADVARGEAFLEVV
jgi:hypothetical protein